MIGKSDYVMPWCDVAETIRKADQLVMKENKTFILEEYGTLASGKKSAFLVSKSPFRDKNGKLFGILGTAVHIGHHRQTLFLDIMKPVENTVTCSHNTSEFSSKNLSFLQSTIPFCKSLIKVLRNTTCCLFIKK